MDIRFEHTLNRRHVRPLGRARGGRDAIRDLSLPLGSV